MDFSRRTGRTTWMLVRALASKEKRIAILFPTVARARYSMEQMVKLIDSISQGALKPIVNRSKMTIEIQESVFMFISADNPPEKGEVKVVIDEFKDHNVQELYDEIWEKR